MLQAEALAGPNMEAPLKWRERGSVCRPDSKQESVTDEAGDCSFFLVLSRRVAQMFML